MKQIKITLIYLAIIPSVIAFDALYTFGRTFYSDVQETKAKVIELEKRIKSLEPQLSASLTPVVLNPAPQYPVVSGSFLPLPSPLTVNRPTRSISPPIDLTVASAGDKTDIPAAGQFTLAGEPNATKGEAPKFVLAGDK